jgi:hypothetical protein
MIPTDRGASVMRDTPNFDDANFSLRLYEIRREPELRKARAMVGDLLDGASWETLHAVMQYEHPENAHFRQVTSYWEIAASFVNRGIFHPDVFLDTCGEALYMYSVLKPHLAKVREANPRFLNQIEKLVAENEGIRARVEMVDKARAAWQAAAAAATATKAAAKSAAKAPKKAAKSLAKAKK